MGDFYTCIDLYIDFFAEIYEYPAGKPGKALMRSCSTYSCHDRYDAGEYAFLNLFWYNSPTPNFNGGVNVMFWVIFILIFVGLALQDSGARMSRQARFLREGVEDQLILEKAKGEEGANA